MQWLVVGSMCKDDGLLDCGCIRGTDYWNVDCSGRTCKLFGAGHLGLDQFEHVWLKGETGRGLLCR